MKQKWHDRHCALWRLRWRLGRLESGCRRHSWQNAVNQDVIALFDVNQPQGFDCPGSAWLDIR
ncbi:MAG: hypothetical protein GPOALKHO_001099 [Sodalis sp.]|nr:MAG: hypothetical protein GPOALKHO_001099 [Sodalis sp.]